MNMLGWLIVTLAVIWTLAFWRTSKWVWTIAVAIWLTLFVRYTDTSEITQITLWSVFLALAVVFNLSPLRRALISKPALKWFRKVLPQISQTEQEALDAGTVWWDGDLFSGRPDWNKLLAFPKPTLSSEERAFLDGPVEQLCEMLNDWEITHELYDLPPQAWQFIKDNGFLGMIIPKQYGGLGFSALAHSEVVMKIITRSSTGAVTVMVPNSLGPAELLLHYGTEEQKNYYLPRLARGLEMPCFALTSPEAGSDAGSIPDFGIVCRGNFEGKDVLGIRVTWEKRYITLGPVATLLGLAFKLYDPDHLLGEKEDIGITLALIPTNTPGVNIGRRHLPLNTAFQNGPNWGKDVFIPMDWVIGGPARVGQGWRMLMECLAAGRAISLPANGVGVSKLCARTTGAYSRIRVQFKVPIGRFEGVAEALARIAGNTYIMDAARVMTVGAVDLGAKPSVISAIVKYHLTERSRAAINDAMDVHGGKGICLGPNNYLGRAYQQTPIGITVEGANILTRSMIIFGQGAIRCHPYVLKEIEATQDKDVERATETFDRALFGHIAFAVSNAARSLFYGITGARFTKVPSRQTTKRYYQHLTRLSAAFALIADVSMLVLGGSLKRKEMLSARLGDVLSQLYLCSAALKRFEDQGRPVEDLPLLDWSLQESLVKTQSAFIGILENFPNRFLASLLKFLVFPTGMVHRAPHDKLSHAVAALLLSPSATRDRLTEGMYMPRDKNDPIAALELALQNVTMAEAIEAKIREAAKTRLIKGNTVEELMEKARQANVISAAEAQTLTDFRALRRKIIMVDDFPPDFGISFHANENLQTAEQKNRKTA